MGIEVSGILGLLVLIGVVWAIINIVQSRASNGAKLLWVVLVLVLPVLGLILWFFMGPRGKQSAATPGLGRRQHEGRERPWASWSSWRSAF